MIKIGKRLLAWLLVFACVFTGRMDVFATDETVTVVNSGNCGESVTWKYTSDRILTISGTGDMESYLYTEGSTDEEDYNRTPWESYWSQIKTVKIEEGVTSVSKYAFYGCESMTELILPETVEYIYPYAFCNCKALEKIDFQEGLKEIKSNAFYKCTGLTELTLPDTLTYIGWGAFEFCTSLTKVVIPKNTKEVGISAFRGCTSLKRAEILGAEKIGSSAFYEDTSLEELVLLGDSVAIGTNALYHIYTDLTIYCYEGSTVQTFAKEGQYRCVVVEKDTIAFQQSTVEKEEHASAFINPVFNLSGLALQFTSSNEAVATVDGETGMVTVKEIGTTVITAQNEGTDTAEYTLDVKTAADMLHNPSYNSDSDTGSWSYVYAGSYPQEQLTGNAVTSDIINATYDSYGDGYVGTKKYRRIVVNQTYQYYAYEPIRWRVLRVSGGKMLLMADSVLDRCMYMKNVNSLYNWDQSMIRSWLNGYDASMNIDGQDYSSAVGQSFIGTAFTTMEQSELDTITVSPTRYDTGSATEDKVYIGSKADYTSSGEGFCTEMGKSKTFAFLTTEYARNKGVYFSSNDKDTYLQTNIATYVGLGDPNRSASSNNVDAIKNCTMPIAETGYYVNEEGLGVLPRIQIDVDSDIWSYTKPEVSYSQEYPGFYTVSFETQGGTKKDSIQLSQEQQVGATADSFRRGYDFGGWYADPLCTRPWNVEGEIVNCDMTLYAQWLEHDAETEAIENPYYYEDRQDGEWGYVYLGSYPASRIIEKTAGQVQDPGIVYLESSEYSKVTEAEYQEDGTAVVDGTRYCKVGSVYYQFEPIKWRVLQNDGSTLLLMADTIVDGKLLNETKNAAVTWNTCTLRSWLNGYDSTTNLNGVDYTQDGFTQTTFTEEQRSNMVAIGDLFGETITDKVTLLSGADAVESDYGFAPADVMQQGRKMTGCSYYASVNSYDSSGPKFWWYRASQNTEGTMTFQYVDYRGLPSTVYGTSYAMYYTNKYGVCPVIRINQNPKIWSITADTSDTSGTDTSGGDTSDTESGGKLVQTISVPQTDYTKSVEDASFSLGAVTDGGGALTYRSSEEKVATVSEDGTVSIVGAGTTIITVLAAETETYKVGCVEVNITVTGTDTETPDPGDESDKNDKKEQTITTPAVNYTKTMGDAAFNLGAVTNGDGTLSYESADETVATVDQDGLVTLVGIGSTTITVTASETETYQKTQKRIAIVVNAKTTTKKRQTISVKNGITNYKRTLGDGKSNIELGATRTGDGILSYETSDSAVATVSSTGEVTIVGAGVVAITITASETEQYLEATREVDITVSRKEEDKDIQTINVPSTILVKVVGGEAFSLGAATDGNGTLQYASSDTNVVTVDEEGIVTIAGEGNAAITISCEGTWKCLAAESCTVNVQVEKEKRTQNIAVASGTYSKTVGDASFNLGAATDGDGTLSYETSKNTIADVDKAGKVTVKAAGTAVITITAAETELYKAATKKVTVTVKAAEKPAETVTQKTQKITVKKSSYTVQAGDKSFSLGATCLGGAKMTFKSSKTGVVTVSSGGTVTVKGAGSAVITITAAENTYYKAASATVKITVKKKSQSITGVSNTIIKAYGASAFTLKPKAKGSAKLSYQSGNTKVVRVSSKGKVTIVGTGRATITIKAASTGTYDSASKKVTVTVTPKQMTLLSVVSKKTRTLTVTWKRDSRAAGYDIYCGTTSSFKGAKHVLVKNNKTVSNAVTKLTKGKTYYVKVRAYITINGKKVYGAYSKVKKAKVK